MSYGLTFINNSNQVVIDSEFARLASQLFFGQSPANLIGFRSGSFANAPFLIIYHTGNTTRAADGTLKAI